MSSGEVELLNERSNLNRHRVDKNRLLCASLLNVLSFFCAIFSMAFPQWIQISFAVNIRQPTQKTAIVTLWSNLLYGYYEGKRLMYPDLQEEICSRDDTFCLAILYELDFAGKLCFSIFVAAFLVSGYDCARIVKFTFSEITTKSRFFVQKSAATHFKNNFRSALMLAAYALGISLDFFAMNIIKLEKFAYGVSFWVFFGSLLLFVVVSVWENRKLSKLARQEMVIRLLQREKQMLRGSDKLDAESSVASSDLFTI